uniref:Uncharacterized protein n=1 Tax=Tetraselmis sp. GSL018 TaxID=582737 RepID=A0A061RFE2_9CHLO
MSVFHRIMEVHPDSTLAMLPYAIPVLEERLQRSDPAQPMAEPCEELRLQLVKLLRLLMINGEKAVMAYAGEIMGMTKAGCMDSFHKVAVETCECMKKFVGIAGMRMGKTGHQLVADVCPLLTDNRFRVRAAALQTLRAIIPTGSHEMILELVAHRDPNVVPIRAFYEGDVKVNFCARLVADRHPAVRSEFLECLGDWLLRLPERRDHEQRLLPYVLSLHNDEVPAISSRAVEIMELLGEQYIRDQDGDERFKDSIYYLPEEAHGLGWRRSGGQAAVYGAESMDTLRLGAQGSGGRREVPMPGPFRRRPGLGARILVQSNFSRVASTMCEELGSWIAEHRPKVARLLLVNLVYQEDHVSAQLHRLLPALRNAIRGDAEMRQLAERCCEVIGCFVDPGEYLQILLPPDGLQTEPPATASTLAVVAALAWGAGPQIAGEPLDRILGVLECEAVAASHDTAVRQEALRLAESIIGASGEAVLGEERRMLAVLLRSMGASALRRGIDSRCGKLAPGPRDGVCGATEGCLERLARLRGHPHWSALAKEHLRPLLGELRAPVGATAAEAAVTVGLIAAGGSCDCPAALCQAEVARAPLEEEEKLYPGGMLPWKKEDFERLAGAFAESMARVRCEAMAEAILASAMKHFLLKTRSREVSGAGLELLLKASSDSGHQGISTAILDAAIRFLREGSEVVSDPVWIPLALQHVLHSYRLDLPANVRQRAVSALGLLLGSQVTANLVLERGWGQTEIGTALRDIKLGGDTSSRDRDESAETGLNRMLPEWLVVLRKALDDPERSIRQTTLHALHEAHNAIKRMHGSAQQLTVDCERVAVVGAIEAAINQVDSPHES